LETAVLPLNYRPVGLVVAKIEDFCHQLISKCMRPLIVGERGSLVNSFLGKGVKID